jgi:hypothetical protein
VCVSPKPPDPRKYIDGTSGMRCRIVPAPAGRFVLYNSDGRLCAEHHSARWLSDSALDSGALSVAFDFDLRILES